MNRNNLRQAFKFNNQNKKPYYLTVIPPDYDKEEQITYIAHKKCHDAAAPKVRDRLA